MNILLQVSFCISIIHTDLSINKYKPKVEKHNDSFWPGDGFLTEPFLDELVFFPGSVAGTSLNMSLAKAKQRANHVVKIQLYSTSASHSCAVWHGRSTEDKHLYESVGAGLQERHRK